MFGACSTGAVQGGCWLAAQIFGISGFAQVHATPSLLVLCSWWRPGPDKLVQWISRRVRDQFTHPLGKGGMNRFVMSGWTDPLQSGLGCRKQKECIDVWRLHVGTPDHGSKPIFALNVSQQHFCLTSFLSYPLSRLAQLPWPSGADGAPLCPITRGSGLHIHGSCASVHMQ